MKVEKAIFNFTPSNKVSNQIGDVIRQLTNQPDFRDFIRENMDTQLNLQIQPTGQIGEKQLLYAYFQVVVLRCAVIGYTQMGYEQMNEVAAEYRLKEMFACGYTISPQGEKEFYLKEKSKMTKSELIEFVNNSIQFIEQELQVKVPDSDAHKIKKKFGKTFTRL